jgi:hypothetical protein
MVVSSRLHPVGRKKSKIRNPNIEIGNNFKYKKRTQKGKEATHPRSRRRLPRFQTPFGNASGGNFDSRRGQAAKPSFAQALSPKEFGNVDTSEEPTQE